MSSPQETRAKLVELAKAGRQILLSPEPIDPQRVLGIVESIDGLHAEIAKLRAENERLREALEDIAVYGCGRPVSIAPPEPPEELK